VRGAVTNPITVNPGDVSALGLLSPAQLDGYTNPTVVRIVGQLRVTSFDTLDNPDSIVGAWGIIALPDATILPADFSPLLRATRPWMMWMPIYLSGTMFHFVQDFPLDIKSQRKMPNQEELTLFVENGANSTDPLEYSIGWRILIRE
jgi:hypothetical protein